MQLITAAAAHSGDVVFSIEERCSRVEEEVEEELEVDHVELPRVRRRHLKLVAQDHPSSQSPRYVVAGGLIF